MYDKNIPNFSELVGSLPQAHAAPDQPVITLGNMTKAVGHH